MEQNKLIHKDRNGLYSVLFSNKTALDVFEIHKIFGQFGEIANIKETGDKKGYRFVKYITLKDAENAVEGLKSQDLIKLIQPKGQQNVEKKPHESSTGKIYEKKTKYKYSPSNIKKENQENSESNRENCNSFPTHSENDSVSKKTNYEKRSSCKNSFKKSEASFLTFCESNTSKHEISKVMTAKSVPKKVFVNAKEIIVGNIHPNYGASYILHLFDCFEPIAISEIKLIAKTGTRYCHVYFKNSADSKGAENRFDQMDLCGQKLVVLSPHNLMQEALNCK